MPFIEAVKTNRKIEMNKPPLRKLLANDQVSKVDALLRRVEHLLSSSTGLSDAEKLDVSEGAHALKSLFYDDKFSNSGGKPFDFGIVENPKHWFTFGKTREGMSYKQIETIDNIVGKLNDADLY